MEITAVEAILSQINKTTSINAFVIVSDSQHLVNGIPQDIYEMEVQRLDHCNGKTCQEYEHGFGLSRIKYWRGRVTDKIWRAYSGVRIRY